MIPVKSRADSNRRVGNSSQRESWIEDNWRKVHIQNEICFKGPQRMARWRCISCTTSLLKNIVKRSPPSSAPKTWVGTSSHKKKHIKSPSTNLSNQGPKSPSQWSIWALRHSKSSSFELHHLLSWLRPQRERNGSYLRLRSLPQSRVWIGHWRLENG